MGVKTKMDELIKEIKEATQLVKALEERVANLENALASGVNTKVSLPITGSNPQERIKNFLALQVDDPEIKAMQDIHDAYLVYYHVCKAKGINPEGLLRERFNQVIRTITSATLPDYVPTMFSSRLIQLIRLQPSVNRVFEQIELPSERFRPPIAFSGLSVTGVGAGSPIPLTDPNAPQVEFVAKKIAGGVTIAEEFSEDSIVAIVPVLMQEFAYAFADALDRAIVQGDTAANDPLLSMWDGLLKKAVTTTNSTWSAQAVAEAIGKFDVPVPNELVLLVHPTDYAKMLGWSEVMTVDKYGAAATIITGEVAKIFGVPVVVTPHVTKVVGTETKRVPLLVAHRRWKLGVRKGISVETNRDVERLRDILVAYMRVDFKPVAQQGAVLAAEVARL